MLCELKFCFRAIKNKPKLDQDCILTALGEEAHLKTYASAKPGITLLVTRLQSVSNSPEIVITAALGWSLVLFCMAFTIGRKVGRKKLARALPVRPQGDVRVFRVTAEPGVEVFFDKSGYRIRVEKIREHRYLAEKCLGRNLSSEEVVHHINGRRSDNRLENLCVLHHMKHEQFHAWLKWKKDKQGYYPAEHVLREVLVQEYSGILLGEVPAEASRAEG